MKVHHNKRNQGKKKKGRGKHSQKGRKERLGEKRGYQESSYETI
jgi:hypothetical protein